MSDLRKYKKPIALRKIDVARITGVKPRTIFDWTAHGWISQAYPKTGQGKIGLYGVEDLVQARILKIVSQREINTSAFAKYINYKKYGKHWFDPFKDLTNKLYLLTIRGEGKYIDDPQFNEFDKSEPHPKTFDFWRIGDYDVLVTINLNKVYEIIVNGINRL